MIENATMKRSRMVIKWAAIAMAALALACAVGAGLAWAGPDGDDPFAELNDVSATNGEGAVASKDGGEGEDPAPEIEEPDAENEEGGARGVSQPDDGLDIEDAGTVLPGAFAKDEYTVKVGETVVVGFLPEASDADSDDEARAKWHDEWLKAVNSAGADLSSESGWLEAEDSEGNAIDYSGITGIVTSDKKTFELFGEFPEYKVDDEGVEYRWWYGLLGKAQKAGDVELSIAYYQEDGEVLVADTCTVHVVEPSGTKRAAAKGAKAASEPDAEGAGTEVKTAESGQDPESTDSKDANGSTDGTAGADGASKGADTAGAYEGASKGADATSDGSSATKDGSSTTADGSSTATDGSATTTTGSDTTTDGSATSTTGSDATTSTTGSGTTSSSSGLTSNSATNTTSGLSSNSATGTSSSISSTGSNGLSSKDATTSTLVTDSSKQLLSTPSGSKIAASLYSDDPDTQNAFAEYAKSTTLSLQVEVKDKFGDAAETSLSSIARTANVQVAERLDVKVVDANGQTVDIKDMKLVVRVSADDAVKALDAKSVQVWYVDESGSTEKSTAELVNGYLNWSTTHLSNYAVLGTKATSGSGTNTNANSTATTGKSGLPQTGDSTVFVAVALAFVAGFAASSALNARRRIREAPFDFGKPAE